MPAYVIFIRERTLDKSELDTYAKMAGPSLEGLPIKFLAAYGRQEVLEGPAPEGVAIINAGTTTCVSGGISPCTPCTPSTDFDGKTRPHGAAIDIGAYEQ